MATALAPSVRELLEFVEGGSRSYAEVMEVWTSNCPRHPAWDDAVGEGLVRVVGGQVGLTALGLRRLDDVRRTL
jgi:hypothetical protein